MRRSLCEAVKTKRGVNVQTRLHADPRGRRVIDCGTGWGETGEVGEEVGEPWEAAERPVRVVTSRVRRGGSGGVSRLFEEWRPLTLEMSKYLRTLNH
ncbi:hypothetical protein EYF80_002757 [Liparis tanakae]|uniref:Uncharacterized protein n=1 Tax=Liparis tanakae TaxID=230148 RepID=A0A4Z2JCH2_9TELE|nr:hypothetical protein EYF80_002757 [Liparis tanakae]